MFAYQWEGGVTVVETCITPTTRVMTRTAIGPKTAVVRIIVCVAGITTGRRSLIAIGMTGITRQVLVLPSQWEACLRVIEGCAAPTLGGMTSATILTKLPVMLIILRMARVTCSGRALIYAINMAGFARDIAVLPCQRESRIAMIKGRATPAVRVMAGPTILAELSVMGIFVRVAGITGAGRALVDAIDVAGFASGIFVLPGQWEARVSVIEGCPAPAVRVMAGPTIPAELSVMGIIGGMTGITIRWRPFERAVLVAGQAGNILMLSSQRKPGVVMVKGHIFPTAGNMALSTILSKLTTMRIV